ncbi:MAG: FHA domain-containing protein [Acidobacteriota bacterium]
MAVIKCPHCGTAHDTKDYAAEGKDRIVKCRQCDFVFVTVEKAARIIRDEGGAAASPHPDEPRTAISSGVPAVAADAAAGNAPVLTLRAVEGPDDGKSWREQKPLIFIGRRNADVILADQEASRQHAVIELHGERLILKDLGSTNGTYVDDAKVSVAEVKNGSRIKIGDTVLVAAIEAPGS